MQDGRILNRFKRIYGEARTLKKNKRLSDIIIGSRNRRNSGTCNAHSARSYKQDLNGCAVNFKYNNRNATPAGTMQ